MTDPVIVVDYDPAWPQRFQILADRVLTAVREIALCVEHVGSTAVPGLAAKPIIDLDVVIHSAGDLPIAIARLAPLGYVHQGHLGIVGRDAFAWPPGESRHHLYVVPVDSPELRRHLAFRDYLRTHPDAAGAYGDLKHRAARDHRSDRDAYMAAKDELVKEILATALASVECLKTGEG